MVQYVTRYQYTNMEHAIQTYSAVEILKCSTILHRTNCSVAEIHEKLCAVYGGLMHCGP